MYSIEESMFPVDFPPLSLEDNAVQNDPSQLDDQPPPSTLSEKGEHDEHDEHVEQVEQDAEVPPREIDSMSIGSSESIPGYTGCKMLTFDDEHITTAYEAWELVYIRDRLTRQSTKSFFGIDLITTWRNEHDGCVMVNPVVSFEQGDLANKHREAIRGFKNRRGTDQEEEYEQDLANRAYDLPADIYDKIQHLIEDKMIATNRNPHRQRVWRVVVLQPGEFQMTGLLPQRKRKHLFSRERHPPATRTWFVILRGEEVKTTKEGGGWKVYDRRSNPWWRIDNKETKEERGQHKAMMKKMDKATSSSLQNGHRPRPTGPFPPPSRPLTVRY